MKTPTRFGIERNEKMGKNSKAYEAEQRRLYREEQQRRAAEKSKRENRLMWMIMGGILAAVLIVAAVALIISTVNQNKANNVEIGELEGYVTSEEATNYVRMSVTYTDKAGKLQSGDIVVQLRPDKAPLTVNNFKDLVSEGFYDGLTFHRVYSGFMIQGGDPDGDGSGGSAKTIKGEFSSNGFANDLSHKRGVISMARSQSPNSASSQFFIMHQDNTQLDGSYAAFGQVVFGMDTVDGIAAIETKRAAGSIDPVPTQPAHPVTIQKMVFVTPTN